MAETSHPQLVASGTLAKTPFAHLLVYLDQRRLSGTLAIWPQDLSDQGRQEERILFRLGRPTAARLLQPASSLESGLNPLFILRDAPYAFYNGDLLGPSEGRLEGNVDPFALIARSLRESARDEVVDAVVEQLGDAKLRIQPQSDLERYNFISKERALVELVLAEPAPVETLIRNSGLESRLAKRVLYLLAITHAIAVYDEQPPEENLSKPEIEKPPETPKKQPSVRPSPPRGIPQPSESLRPKKNSSHELMMNSIPPAPQALDNEAREQWEEIRELSRTIDKLNYFEMLKIETNTPPDEVRKAFFTLAKRWHPDRLSEPLLPLKTQVEVVFGYLSQAHQCLTNEQERLQHLRTIKEGGGTPAAQRALQQVLDCAMAYQRVEVLAKKREYDQALQLLERILTLSASEADYHAMHAWLLLQKHPEGDAPLKEMLNATEKALKLNKDHERAIYYRGLVLKRMKREEEALKFFRRAAELNPKNLDALREVRIASMRKGERRESQKGLFSSLFKKK
ncbi:MAG: DnaJ domain-containing protein [Deltaproteobacteria bacterium]|nr:DnaJ domain-containing protein [Deltaproteobacteria bacterium]